MRIKNVFFTEPDTKITNPNYVVYDKDFGKVLRKIILPYSRTSG